MAASARASEVRVSGRSSLGSRTSDAMFLSARARAPSSAVHSGRRARKSAAKSHTHARRGVTVHPVESEAPPSGQG